ncbi:MAG TPA: ABC transporter ATP-binding protein [Amycolatopsis sp.]|jgi:iron complex transport system ATP-binding protein|nr:ABC transporter ATP-binding protein [Amycolatopsis sp.]
MAVMAQTPETGTPPNVEITGLNFAYARGGHRLDDVSLTVHRAQVCCLLGPNGTGKTTLLRCLLGLLKPERGQVRVAGRDVSTLSPRELARLVAYVPQTTTTPFPFTTLEIVVMGRTPHLSLVRTPSAADRREALAQLDRLGIAALAERPFSLLSGGERQLALLARALVQQAPVLLLDEPTAALDYGNETRILQTIGGLAREGRSVLMTTHQPAHALAHAHHVALMRGGTVVAQGPPSEVVTGERLSSLYGVGIHVARVTLPGSAGHTVATCLPIPQDDSG